MTTGSSQLNGTSDLPADFWNPRERAVADRFLEHGHLIVEAENRTGLDRIRDRIAELAAGHLGTAAPDDADKFLNCIHQHMSVDGLNALRLAVINGLSTETWFRPTYFSLARQTLEVVVGNELAMQRRVGLSVQLPEDSSSLLPIHADVWDGDSPFEVVLWVPLVNCMRTKSMFIFPPEQDREIQDCIARFEHGGPEQMYKAIQGDAEFLTVNYGQVLLFSQTLMHGNRVNEEDETRWSMNCRFKSLMSPYADKKIGEFFEPIVMRPATRMGMGYEFPGGFSERAT